MTVSGAEIIGLERDPDMIRGEREHRRLHDRRADGERRRLGRGDDDEGPCDELRRGLEAGADHPIERRVGGDPDEAGRHAPPGRDADLHGREHVLVKLHARVSDDLVGHIAPCAVGAQRSNLTGKFVRTYFCGRCDHHRAEHHVTRVGQHGRHARPIFCVNVVGNSVRNDPVPGPTRRHRVHRNMHARGLPWAKLHAWCGFSSSTITR